MTALHRLAPGGESGTFDLGEPYYSCPIRFAYPDEFRDGKAPYGFIDAGSCDLVLVNESDVSHVKAQVPVVSLPEVQNRLTDPRGLFDFLFSYKRHESIENSTGLKAISVLRTARTNKFAFRTGRP
jgi:hypothetical protein